MMVLVDCRRLDLRQAKGLENFAISIITGLAQNMDSVVVDMCPISRTAYRTQFKECRNVSLICDPIQGFLRSAAEAGFPGRVLAGIRQRVKRRFKVDVFAPRRAWALSQQADVAYYPSHLNPMQHDHLPRVSTVHAVLPEYTPVEMAVLEDHMRNASAVVTSWPHPFNDLGRRYPFVKERLFLVPFSAMHLTTSRAEDSEPKRPVGQDYLLYPSVVVPRKNHINLIEACAILRQQRKSIPLIICTGGGKSQLQDQLMARIRELHLDQQFRFLGHVTSAKLTGLYRGCLGTISPSLWEAGIAPLQEGGVYGKPIICSNIAPAKEHAELFGLDACFFDPKDPHDIARQLMAFLNNIDFYRQSSVRASLRIRAVNQEYVGRCYTDILKFAAGRSPRPQWFPFLQAW